MDVSIGSYKNPLDMEQKYKAYMKLLTASSNIQRQNTEAFQRKKELGDVIPRNLDEMPLYANEQERQLDTIAQKKKSRDNLREIFKSEKDVKQAMIDLEKQPQIDPFDGSQLPSPFALFNLYFGELKEKVKRLAGLTPSAMLKYYKRLLEEKEEDLLPNKKTLGEIKSILQEFRQQGASRTQEVESLLERVELGEREVNRIAQILTEARGQIEEIQPAVDSVRQSISRRGSVSTPSTEQTTPSRKSKANQIPIAFARAQRVDPSFTGGTFEYDGGVINLYPTLEDYPRGMTIPRLRDLTEFINMMDFPNVPVRRRRSSEEEEEKIALTEGMGVGYAPSMTIRRRGRPRRIVGGGIEVPKRDADWYYCGIFRISKNLLDDNQLSVYYAKSLGRPAIHKLKRTINISDKLRDFLLHLLKKKEIHLPSFYKLSKSEQALIMDLLKGGKCKELLEESFGGEIPSIQTDELENAIHRFGLIKGQIEAGNNHPDLLKELTEHIDTMHQYGQLSNNDRVKIYKTLLHI
jgi:hypothetical protein